RVIVTRSQTDNVFLALGEHELFRGSHGMTSIFQFSDCVLIDALIEILPTQISHSSSPENLNYSSLTANDRDVESTTSEIVYEDGP
ncbi:hypothetical protein PENTCL1PPCAC_7982, partial [Pristionchus entomophagus]